jgi:hypothetical protein
VTLSAAKLYQLINIIGIEAYTVNMNLVYVVQVPLASHYSYHVHKILPFPIKVQGTSNKFTFIHPEKEYIITDTTKQFYARLRHEELISCTQMYNNKLVCKQNFPLPIIHSSSDYGALMLQPIRSVPDSCEQRVLELKETLWAPLRDNSWIFIAPIPEQTTVMCPDQNPMNMEIKDSGLLTFLADCTGYGKKTMIRAIASHYVNNTDKDTTPPLILDIDCCDTTINKLTLNELQLEAPLKNILTHNSELELSSYKIKDVEKLVEEQEWKFEALHKDYSPLSVNDYWFNCIDVVNW